jgi:hypothetical protein
MKKEQTINTNIRFDESQSEYTVQIKERKKYWWLLLLLLLIPLFINLEKDIAVQTFDQYGKPVSAAKVEFNFVASHLYKHGKFFFTDTLSGRRSERTDDNGTCVFKDCPYSVYGMIFKMFHKSRINISSDCIAPFETKQCYYYTFGKQTLYVEKESADITVKVLDSEDNEPISEATVHYRYQNGDKITVDSAKTNSAGYIVLKGTNKCGQIDFLRGSCYGYKDDTKENLNIIRCLRDPSTANLLLEPIKESVVFFVTNCNSRQPLPGAKATVTVSNPKKSKTYDVSTNTDGRGRASWHGFHILSEISIVASKTGFKNGAIARKYTVEEFVKLPDSLRTICLEPNPRTMNFVNVDTLTQDGIKGIKNEITITSASRTANHTEFSGANGVFYVEVLEGDEVIVASEKSPDYYPAQKHFISLSASKNIIYMTPKDTLLYFRVLDAKDRFPVQTVADVLVKCYQRGKQIYIGDSTFVQNSASNGNYHATVFYPYDVTFEVSAKDYNDNFQITGVPVKDLFADPDKRDILMEQVPKTCTGQTFEDYYKKNPYICNEHDMSGYLGEFLLEYNTESAPDTIIIYNTTKDRRNISNRIFYYEGATKSQKTATVKFTSPVITVEIFGRSTAWSYRIRCPK